MNIAWEKMAWLAVASVVLIAPLLAQNESLESGFKLRQPEDFSSWQISYTYAKPVKPKDAKDSVSIPQPEFEPWGIKNVKLILTKPLWYEEMRDTQGGKIEYWHDGQVTFYKTNGDPLPRLVADYSQQPVIGNKGFRDLEWVGDKTFVGQQKLESRQYLVFAKNDIKVWVDVNSHYPVRWQRGNETRDYQQLPAPKELLTMPTDIAQESEALQHDLELYKRPVPRLGRR